MIRARSGALARMLAAWLKFEPIEPDVLARARVRQIANLIRQTPLMAAVTILNSALLTIALWQTTSRPLLLGWLALVWAVWAVVMMRWRRQSRREPPRMVRPATMKRAVFHTSFAGALWGLGAILLFPPDAPLQQLVLAFVISGMGAGAVASMSSFPAACHAFILASATPFAINFLRVGNSTPMVLGVMVLVFQEGVGEGFLNFESAGTIEIFMPLFLFAVLFGLSMDYHMLVLSRVKEAYDAGSSNEDSVSLGIKATAVLITSAALVMVLVFGAFATSRIMFFKQIGVGLGVAIFLDATIIRAVLLPASMKLLGDWNWYLPKWLEWLPRISAEGDRRVEAPRGSADDE